MSCRIIIAGGGTGGHIFPALAVANALKKLKPETEILFIGALGKMEMEKVPKAGYKIEGLNIAGFNRSHWWKNFGLPFKLIHSHFRVKKIFREFKPNAAFGVGGYSSFPVLRYAQSVGIPTFLHEANAFGGKANAMLAKKAVRVYAGAIGLERFFPAEKIVFTGNPVRENLVDAAINMAEAKRNFGLTPAAKTVLIVGGSLGALSINKAVAAGLQKFRQNGLQVIWQTGKTFNEEARGLTSQLSGVWQGEFIDNMAEAYAAADMVISRAGAMSVAELCIAGKPTIFVPFPFAAEDHQTANAQALVKEGAALMVKDNDAASDLVSTAIALSKDETVMKNMAEKIKTMAVRNADYVIAKNILSTVCE